MMKTIRTGKEGCGEENQTATPPAPDLNPATLGQDPAAHGPDPATTVAVAPAAAIPVGGLTGGRQDAYGGKDGGHCPQETSTPQDARNGARQRVPHEPRGLWQDLAREVTPPADHRGHPGAAFWPPADPGGSRRAYCPTRGAAVFVWLQDLHAWLPVTAPATAEALPTPGCWMAMLDLTCVPAESAEYTELAVSLDALVARDRHPELAWAWWRYVDYRWRVFGEWPDAETQFETLMQMRMWPDPIGSIMDSIAAGYKGVFPRREDLRAAPGNLSALEHAGMVLTSTRAMRRLPHRFAVRDSVPLFLPTHLSRRIP
ncbi:MAG: hypothetical protein FGM24_04495 [Candidatus Kapabacteria bacterium]|nr:hypothetical protein [Candidatus Kapabacteria bacterium]